MTKSTPIVIVDSKTADVLKKTTYKCGALRGWSVQISNLLSLYFVFWSAIVYMSGVWQRREGCHQLNLEINSVIKRELTNDTRLAECFDRAIGLQPRDLCEYCGENPLANVVSNALLLASQLISSKQLYSNRRLGFKEVRHFMGVGTLSTTLYAGGSLIGRKSQMIKEGIPRFVEDQIDHFNETCGKDRAPYQTTHLKKRIVTLASENSEILRIAESISRTSRDIGILNGISFACSYLFLGCFLYRLKSIN